MGTQLSKPEDHRLSEKPDLAKADQATENSISDTTRICSLCFKYKEDVVFAAEVCEDCGRGLCPACFAQHKELAIMTSQDMIDLPINNNGPGSQGGLQLPDEKCGEHGKALDAYCVNHKLVICSSCRDHHHKECEQVKHIPEYNKSFIKIKSDTERLLEDLLSAKRSREDLMRQVDIIEREDLEAVQTYRKNTEKRLDEILESMRDKVGERRKGEREDIKNEIEHVEKSFEVMESDYKKLCELKNGNESELHICAQSVTQYAENAVELMMNVGKNRPTSLAKYILSGDFENHAGRFHCQGTFTSSDKLKKEYDIEERLDEKISNIGAIIQRSSKIVIITNYSNNNILCLNLSDGKNMILNVNGGPWGVCMIGENEFAITLADRKQVAFYTVQEMLTIKEAVESDRRPWFSTEGTCWNIGYHDIELYISIKDPSKTKDGCYIGVYSLSGELLRKIDTDPLGKRIFSQAWEIKAHAGFIYVADEEKGIVKMDKHGNEISCITDKDLRKPKAFVFLNNGDMLVAGHDSENVIHFDKTGRRVAVLLSRYKDSLAQPSTLMFNSADSTLLVGSYESAIVQVFDLKGVLSQ